MHHRDHFNGIASPFTLVDISMASANTLLESTATLESQALRCGLSQAWIDGLKASNVATLAQLAYAGTMPGTPVTDAAVQAFANVVRPAVALTVLEMTSFNRLVFEAQTMAISNLRLAVQGTDESAGRKLAPQEWVVKLADQRARLQGIEHSGQLEPAYWLYDQFTTMLETDELKYIAPNRCLTRQQELSGNRPDKQIKIDDKGAGLVVKDNNDKHEIVLHSDLSVHQAMTRRALAMDIVGIATFNVVQRWHSRLFEMMAQTPAPGFSRPTQTQLLRADRQAFPRLSQMVTGRLKGSPAGVLPLDDAFDRLHADITVTYFMLPTSSSSTDVPIKDPPRAPVSDGPYGKGKGKKGKGKGKSSPRTPMPVALIGMHPRTPQGEDICYSFNLNKCKNKNCTRKHVCCVPGCYQPHPQTEHVDKKKN